MDRMTILVARVMVSFSIVLLVFAVLLFCEEARGSFLAEKRVSVDGTCNSKVEGDPNRPGCHYIGAMQCSSGGCSGKDEGTKILCETAGAACEAKSEQEFNDCQCWVKK